MDPDPVTCYVTAGRCDVTLLCSMQYSNPHAQLPLPSWPAPTTVSGRSATAAHHGGCQFAGIGLLHQQLHLLLCATRQPFSLLHALGCPKRCGANRPVAAVLPACCCGGRAAFITADSRSHPRLCCLAGLVDSWPLRRCAAGTRQAVIKTWLEDACINKGS